MTSRMIYDPKQYKYACALGVHPDEQFEVLNKFLKTYEEMRFLDIEKEAEKTRKVIEKEQEEWRKENEVMGEEMKVFNPKKRKGRRGRRKQTKKKEKKRGDWKKFQNGGIIAMRANIKLQKIMAEDYGVPFLMTSHTTQELVFFIFRDFYFIYNRASEASKASTVGLTGFEFVFGVLGERERGLGFLR